MHIWFKNMCIWYNWLITSWHWLEALWWFTGLIFSHLIYLIYLISSEPNLVRIWSILLSHPLEFINQPSMWSNHFYSSAKSHPAREGPIILTDPIAQIWNTPIAWEFHHLHLVVDHVSPMKCHLGSWRSNLNPRFFPPFQSRPSSCLPSGEYTKDDGNSPLRMGKPTMFCGHVQ